MNQLSLVDVQWSWLSLFVSLFLDCVKFRRKKWKRSFTIETPVYVRCNLPTLYWLRMQVSECFSQTAFYNPVVMLLCPCVCFKPVTLFGVASILCQNFREGHSGIAAYHLILCYHHVKSTIPTIRKLLHSKNGCENIKHHQTSPLTCST